MTGNSRLARRALSTASPESRTMSLLFGHNGQRFVSDAGKAAATEFAPSRRELAEDQIEGRPDQRPSRPGRRTVPPGAKRGFGGSDISLRSADRLTGAWTPRDARVQGLQEASIGGIPLWKRTARAAGRAEWARRCPAGGQSLTLSRLACALG